MQALTALRRRENHGRPNGGRKMRVELEETLTPKGIILADLGAESTYPPRDVVWQGSSVGRTQRDVACPTSYRSVVGGNHPCASLSATLNNTSFVDCY